MDSHLAVWNAADYITLVWKQSPRLSERDPGNPGDGSLSPAGLLFRRNHRVRDGTTARCSGPADAGFLGMLDTSERQYQKQVWDSLGFRDRFPTYKTELRLAWCN